MKMTITESEFINRFRAVRPENFSREGLAALFAYYTELEEGSGEEMEFDPVAICCDWTEYSSHAEAAESYSWDGAVEADDERADQNEAKAQTWLNDQTMVLETSGSVLVLNF